MVRSYRSLERHLGITLIGLALLACAVQAAPTVPAQDVLVFDLGMDRLAVQEGFQALLDPSGELEIHTILAAGDSLPWRTLPDRIPRFGYTRDTIWLHFRILNEGLREDLVMSLDQSVIDNLEYVQVADGRIVDHEILGDALPYMNRPIESVDLAWAVEFPNGWTQDIYLKLQSSSSVHAPLTVWQKAEFFQASNQKSLLNGLLFGIIFAIVLYGLIVYTILRDVNYLTFSFYTVVFLAIPFTLQGYGYKLLWPGSPWLQEHAFLIIMPVLSVASVVFARRILNYPGHLPRLDRIMKTYALLKAVSIAPLLHVDYSVGIRYSMLSGLLDELVILASGIYIWRKFRHRPAAYFTLAWVAFLAGTSSLVFNRFGLIDRSLATDLGPSLGIVAQALVMSLGLAESIRESRTAVLKAEQALVKHRREAGRKLKIEVQQRTAELQQVMRQLARMNEEFEEANRLDGLTRVFNRSAFDDRLTREFRRAQRGNNELTVIMIDIDHFKRFNDDHGHQVGDHCLIEVAGTIDRTARRTDDFTARYGGEEFAVILVNTPQDAALNVAERIRKAVQQLDFRVEGLRVPVTVSLGVCTARPGKDDNAEAIVAAADAALYRAKGAGRNQVAGAEVPLPQPS